MTTTLTPLVYPQTFQNQQAVIPMEPLAGQIGSGTAPYNGSSSPPSPWQAVPAGSVLDLTLTLANYTGTLSVILETCNQVVAGVNVDPPQFLGSFAQSLGTGSPTPVTANLVTRPCGPFVRVLMTPGAGGGQAADWNVSGKAITAAYTPLSS